MSTRKLAPLPPLPSSSKPRAKVNACECGCRTLVARRFVPGHDSYLKAWVTRVRADQVAIADVPDGHREAVARVLGIELEPVASGEGEEVA
jgi:hypothetical protein